MIELPHLDQSKPTVLVTGAAGLLGRHIVRELLSQGLQVRGFDLRSTSECNEFHIGDITDAAAVKAAVQGCFAAIHAAARPNIWSGNGDDILRINTLGAWNVFKACEEAGVGRVVFCSSDSVMGYTVVEGSMVPPDYVPVDCAHPLRATDPYALSKILGEDIARSFAYRGLEIVALRTVFVAYPEMEGEIRARAIDPASYAGRKAGGPSSAGGGPLYNHIDPRDLARAFMLSLQLAQPGTPACPFEAFYVASKDTLAPEPTVARLERILGRKVEVRDSQLYEKNPYASLYDLRPARERLGFTPEFSQRPLIEPVA